MFWIPTAAGPATQGSPYSVNIMAGADMAKNHGGAAVMMPFNGAAAPMAMNTQQMYVMGPNGVAMPVAYMPSSAPSFTPSAPAGGPSATVMMTPNGQLVYAQSGAAAPAMLGMGQAPMTIFPSATAQGGVSEDALRAFSIFASPAQSAMAGFPAAGGFMPIAPFAIPAGEMPPPPRYSSVVKSDYHGGSSRSVFGSHPTPVVRNGDAGKGYEAGVYYEGRVKRFNPVRGYGFVSATHKLVPLSEYKKMKAAAATAASANHTDKDSVSNHSVSAADVAAAAAAGAKNSPVGVTMTKLIRSPEVKPLEKDAPLVSAASFDSAPDELAVEVNPEDLVYIKGVPHVRCPVTMGDIFVHYHCLQRTPGDLETETNDGLVNLPAGSRVQFKAEVFVPAELMEKATDNKQAAAMLNNLGVPVEEDPNLLSGAIATKKGWGYQAIEVYMLPAKGTLPTQMGPLNAGSAVAATAATTSATSQRCIADASVNSVRSPKPMNAPHTPNTVSPKQHSVHAGELSPAASMGASLSPSTHALKVQMLSDMSRMPPPPSFEAATAGMQFVMAPNGNNPYMTGYFMNM